VCGRGLLELVLSGNAVSQTFVCAESRFAISMSGVSIVNAGHKPADIELAVLVAPEQPGEGEPSLTVAELGAADGCQ
jgi:hypothetical protein